jgi:zinc protease
MRLFLNLFLALGLCGGAAVFAEENAQSVRVNLNVEKWTLPNGLTVLFHEDHSVPLVSYQQWFRVGSKDEVPGHTGLAHFFEHLMFKGSKNYPKETFNRVLNAKGANFNAFTTTDYTGYFINAPSSQLEFIIKVEADRMRNLIISPEEIKTEREVVKEERRTRYENSPEGYMWVALPELMYQNLPYRWPTIGSMKDLNDSKTEDFQNFYNEFYAPNNAVVVVAGHFDTAQVKKWIQAQYGSFQAQKLERPKVTPEPEQKKARQKIVPWKVQSPIVMVAYPTVDVQDQDSYALEILGTLLGSGESSRLYHKLVYQDQLATGVSSFNYAQVLAGKMMFIMNLKKGVSPATAKKLLENEIWMLINKGVSAGELEKAKNQILTGQVEELKKVSGRARALVYNEIIFGDYKRLFTDLEKYLAVTPEDLQRVAKKYLVPEHENIVIIQPQ